jgi:hypothetical protein
VISKCKHEGGGRCHLYPQSGKTLCYYHEKVAQGLFIDHRRRRSNRITLDGEDLLLLDAIAGVAS